MIIVLLMCFGLIVLLAYRPKRFMQVRMAEACLLAAIYCATFVWGVNLALSASHKLTANWIALAWGVFACALTIEAWRQHQEWTRFWRFKRVVRRYQVWWAHLDATRGLCLAIILIVFTITLSIGLWSLPNNHDAMTYDLPRVMRWIQDRQIKAYPTSIPEQIYQHIGAEHLQLQVYLLTGSDSAMHMVQWLAFIGSILAVGLIVRELRGRTSAVWLAMVLAASFPMAIFQSTNCKNDLLLASFVLVAVWLMLRLRNSFYSLRLIVALMFACGWVLITKGTGYVYLPVPILAMTWIIWFYHGWLRAIVVTSCTGLVCTCMIAWQWWVNWTIYGSIFGPKTSLYRPHGNIIAAMAINTLRDLGSELSTPIQTINNLIIQGFQGFLFLFGLSLNDTRSMNYSSTYFLNAYQVLSEDHAGAPLLMVLILVAIVIILLRGTRLCRTYFFLWSFIGLALTGLVSWNQWITRLLLPAMLLAIPLVALAFSFDRWPKAWQRTLLWLCLLMATPALLFNYNRSILGPNSMLMETRTQAQLISAPVANHEFNQIIVQLQRRVAYDLGLDLGPWFIEYPFWQRMGGPSKVHIQHVVSMAWPNSVVQEKSAHLPHWLIVWVDESLPPQTTMVRYIGQVRYDRRWRGDRYALFERALVQPD